MKRLRLILLAAITIFSFSVASAQKTFSEATSIKGVTSVYLGKPMLALAGNAISAGNVADKVDMSKILKDLNSLEILVCDGKAKKKAAKVCDAIIKKMPLEIITEVNDENNNVTISGIFNTDGETLNTILMSVADKNELVYVLMKGKIPLDDLNSALAPAAD